MTNKKETAQEHEEAIKLIRYCRERDKIKPILAELKEVYEDEKLFGNDEEAKETARQIKELETRLEFFEREAKRLHKKVTARILG